MQVHIALPLPRSRSGIGKIIFTGVTPEDMNCKFTSVKHPPSIFNGFLAVRWQGNRVIRGQKLSKATKKSKKSKETR